MEFTPRVEGAERPIMRAEAAVDRKAVVKAEKRILILIIGGWCLTEIVLQVSGYGVVVVKRAGLGFVDLV